MFHSQKKAQESPTAPQPFRNRLWNPPFETCPESWLQPPLRSLALGRSTPNRCLSGGNPRRPLQVRISSRSRAEAGPAVKIGALLGVDFKGNHQERRHLGGTPVLSLAKNAETSSERGL